MDDMTPQPPSLWVYGFAAVCLVVMVCSMYYLGKCAEGVMTPAAVVRQ